MTKHEALLFASTAPRLEFSIPHAKSLPMSKTVSKQNASRQSTSPQGSRGRSTPGRSTKATSGHPGSVARWTFLSNHAHVLICLAEQPDARLRDLAERVGITERAVQSIVTDLEGSGAITRIREGRRNRYEFHPDVRLRHPVEANSTIRDLLAIVGKKLS